MILTASSSQNEVNNQEKMAAALVFVVAFLCARRTTGMVFQPWRRVRQVLSTSSKESSSVPSSGLVEEKVLEEDGSSDELEVLRSQVAALRKEVEVAEEEEAKYQLAFAAAEDEDDEDDAIEEESQSSSSLFSTAAAAAAAATAAAASLPAVSENQVEAERRKTEEERIEKRRWSRSKDGRLFSRERSLSWCREDTVDLPTSVSLDFADALGLDDKEEWFLERLEVLENGKIDFLCSPKLLSLLLTIPEATPRGWLAKSVTRVEKDGLFLDVIGADDFDPYYEVAKTPLSSVFVGPATDTIVETSKEKEWFPEPRSMLASRCGLTVGPDATTEKARAELSDRLDLCGRALWRRWRNAVSVYRRPLAELELAALGLGELANNDRLNEGVLRIEKNIDNEMPLDFAQIATECRASIEAKLFGAAAQLSEENFETEYIADRRVFRNDISDQAKLDAVRLAHRSVRATAAGLLLALDSFLYDREKDRSSYSNGQGNMKDLEDLLVTSSPRAKDLIQAISAAPDATDKDPQLQLDMLQSANPKIRRLIALESASSWLSNLIIFGALLNSVLLSAAFVAIFVFVFNFAHPLNDAMGDALKPALDTLLPNTGPNDVSTGSSGLDRIVFPDDFNREGWWTRL